jgi:multiple sugar transport system permease protein
MMNAAEKSGRYVSVLARRRRSARFYSEQLVPRVVLILMCALFLLPFYWMAITSLKGTQELRAIPPTLWPREFHFENYSEAIEYIPFLRFFWNSSILAILSVAGAVLTNSTVAYGLSRIEWRGREPIFYLVISTMFIPFPVTLVALFDIFAKFKLVNTYVPLVLPHFVGTATYIFMMRQFLLGIPREISSAGIIDGANEMQVFMKLILPLMRPVIAVVAIFTAITSWNDFMTPLIYLQAEELYPLSIGLQFFRAEHRIEYSMLMAASTLVVLPVIVIFLIFQRFFVEGITVGAVKG